jgi:general secretion pathway protein C
VDDNRRMSARWWTLVIWALVAGSALFWGLKLASRPLPVPPQALVAEPGAALRGDLSRLLGATAPAPVAEPEPVPASDARFALIGVVNPKASRAAREGLALIAVDGKPARAYRVGAMIEGTHELKSVSARGATLGLKDGDGQVALSIAPPAPAATGSLPVAGAVAPGSPRAAALQRAGAAFTPAQQRPLGLHSGPGRPQLMESAPAVQPESPGGGTPATE